MSPTSDAAAFLGRLLLSVIFVLRGFQKLAQFSGTVAFMGSEGLPLPLIAAIVAILVECVGGILLIVGYQTRLTGIILALWCIATAIVAHRNFGNQDQMIHFLKNAINAKCETVDRLPTFREAYRSASASAA